MLALRAYVPETQPQVALAAEIAGTSVRTLQRRLTPFGMSYSRLVQQMRFEAATELLAKPDIRMLDVAHAVGYEDQAHFTRAFRRFAGVSPTEYRRQREHC
jgi:AraC-like DNA-binding protein